ncbi:hypothetical protein Pcac1_g25493 [Phytophthora cactorum]|nr:hypothetical protein Pcac1_g25493 [Phytophthora cactorum]KAG3195286.1 hypothetical protein PC128_g8630 [Phytophthora cactorum]
MFERRDYVTSRISKGLQIEADKTTDEFHRVQPTGRLEPYFETAMDRFLRERQAAPVVSRSSQPNHAGTQDVDMKSVGSPTHAEDAGEYDPDDLDFPTANRAAIAITAGGSGPSYVIQRVRISAMSDLKEFTGRDRMMSGARSWLSKVKSAFLRDQASDDDKCLTFADLLSGPARN